MSETTAVNSSSKSKAHSRKIAWDKVALTVAIHIGTGLISGIAMGAGTALMGSLAGGSAEAAAAATGALSLVKKVV